METGVRAEVCRQNGLPATSLHQPYNQRSHRKTRIIIIFAKTRFKSQIDSDKYQSQIRFLLLQGSISAESSSGNQLEAHALLLGGNCIKNI